MIIGTFLTDDGTITARPGNHQWTGDGPLGRGGRVYGRAAWEAGIPTTPHRGQTAR